MALTLFAGGPNQAQAQSTPTPAIPGLTVTSNDANNSLIVRWGAVTGAATYLVHWKSGTQEYSDTRSTSQTARTYTIAPLTEGTTYTVRVRAENAANDTVAESEVFASPGRFSVTVAQQGGSMLVEWDEVACEPGPCVTDYLVQWRIPGSDDFSRTTRGQSLRKTDKTECSGAGKMCWSTPERRMSRGATYVVKVTAYTGQAQHYRQLATSAEPSLTIPASDPSAAVVIQGVDVRYASDTSLTVNWTKPNNTTKYRVYWKTDGQDFADSRRSAELSAATATYTISGLEPRTRYWAVVRAYDTNGARIGGSEQTSGWTSKFSHATLEPYGDYTLRAEWGTFPNIRQGELIHYKFSWWRTEEESFDQASSTIITPASANGNNVNSKNFYIITGLNGSTNYTVRLAPFTKPEKGSEIPGEFIEMTARTSGLLLLQNLEGCTVNYIHSGTNTLINAFLRLPDEDISLTNNQAGALWSDGETMWVSDWTNDKVYAYNMANQARDSAKDINNLASHGNDTPSGIWSDGEVIWVTDWTDNKLYAYELHDADGDGNRNERISGSDITLATGNDKPYGIWSDGSTIWVVDDFDNKLYAYELHDADGDGNRNERISGMDFNNVVAGSRDIWSDGETMWVSQDGTTTDGIYAYSMSTRLRDDTKFVSIDLPASSPARVAASNPNGIWSDGEGEIFWTVSQLRKGLTAYAYPTEVKLDSSCTSRKAHGRYARYYTFFVTNPGTGKEWLIKVDARGVAPNPISPHVILRDGGADGTILAEDIAVQGGDNSASVKIADGIGVPEATYTIEVTTASFADLSGNFDISVAVIKQDAGTGIGDSGPQAPDTAPTVSDTSKFKTHYATVGESFSLVLPAADADSGNGGPYAYSLLKRSDGTAFSANGLSFDATTRTLSGTPTAEDTHELTYQVHDGDGNKAKTDAFVEETKLKVVVVPGGNAVGNNGPQQSQKEPANRVPAFDAGIVTTLTLDENSAASTKVGKPITATDPDSGDTVTYSLSGTDAASFVIGSSTGQITTVANVDYNYEAKSSYSLSVDASDGKLSNSTPVTVNLNDVAEAPTVSDTSAFKTHNATVGTTFSLVLPAADANSGDGGPYSYLLWHQGAGKNFATEAVNGLSFNATTRTLSGTPEAAGTWQLSYVVHDGDANTNAAADAFRERDKLKIVVAAAGQATGDGSNGPQESNTKPANRAPAFDAGIVTTLKVDENSAAGTKVGKPITATDPDAGDTVTYSLTGTDAASFAIGSSTGQITTVSDVTYDFETKSSYSLEVDVSDGKGGTDSTPVTVKLNDVNEAPAFPSDADTTLTVDENSAAATNVGDAITATDPDKDATLTYSLSGTDAASFAIGGSTGQITTIADVEYNYESKSSYSLTVDVSDGKLTDSIDVTVSLNNVNEAPAFADGTVTTLSVDENSAAGTKVGSVFTAADPDAGDTLAYSLSGTDAASFVIGGSTGQIATKSGVTYNHEAKSSYSLTVVATDAGGLTDSVAVTVSLNNVAEAPTVADTTQFKNHAATVGQTFSLTLPAADENSGDGDPYEYLLWHPGHGRNFMDQAINGLSFDATTRRLSGTPTVAGVWKLSCVVHDDDDGRSVEDRFRARTNLQVTVSQ